MVWLEKIQVPALQLGSFSLSLWERAGVRATHIKNHSDLRMSCKDFNLFGPETLVDQTQTAIYSAAPSRAVLPGNPNASAPIAPCTSAYKP